MSHYKLTHIDMAAGRNELHNLLELTGVEISLNTLPAGVSVPFVHTHKKMRKFTLSWRARESCTSMEKKSF